MTTKVDERLANITIGDSVAWLIDGEDGQRQVKGTVQGFRTTSNGQIFLLVHDGRKSDTPVELDRILSRTRQGEELVFD